MSKSCSKTHLVRRDGSRLTQAHFTSLLRASKMAPRQEACMQTASKYRGEDHLTLTYRGATIRLEADDPRLPFIELLLFGQTLPLPLPVPEVEVAPVEVKPEAAKVHVPEAWVKLWQTLPSTHRKLLLAFQGEPLTAPEIEKKFGLEPGGLRGLNILISLRARDVLVPMPIQGVGRGRNSRRYFIDPQTRAWVNELERRWGEAEAAMSGGGR